LGISPSRKIGRRRRPQETEGFLGARDERRVLAKRSPTSSADNIFY
jgi:hypothetical protein